MEIKIMNAKKANAAYLLSDEIYATLKSVTLTNRLLSSALDYRVDDEDLGKLGHHEALYMLSELSWRMDLMVQQISDAGDTLKRLDSIGQDYLHTSGNDIVSADTVTEFADKGRQADEETLARVCELISDLGPAEQQQVLKMFGVDIGPGGENNG